MTREDLNNYRYSQKWIEEQIQIYNEQRERVLNITRNIDGMPKAYNKPNYELENLLDKYNYILEILNKDQEKQSEILKQIRLVKEPYRTILTSKYIHGKSLEEISYNVNYAYENICRMHRKALKMFDELNTESYQ